MASDSVLSASAADMSAAFMARHPERSAAIPGPRGAVLPS
jgi:hypothetical protein